MSRPIPPGLDSISKIIDSFQRPGFDKLSTYLDYHGPYQGNNTITQWSETPGPVFTNWSVTSAFGVVVVPNGAIPPAWGFNNGWVDEPTAQNCVEWVPPFGTMFVQTQLANRFWITVNRVVLDVFPNAVVWDRAVGVRLGLYVQPGINLDLYFLSWGLPS